MTPCNYKYLGELLSPFAAAELQHVTDRIALLKEQLLETAPQQEDRRAVLERKLLILVGQGAGLLKVIEHELGRVHLALHLDDEGEGRWPDVQQLDAIVPISNRAA